MKIKMLWLAAFSFPLAASFAQTQKFDIATFIPPLNWQRTDTNGTVSFFNSKKINGQTSFCQIILYASSNSTNTADKNFKKAWQNLVTVPAKSNVKPVTQTQNTPDGWTVVMGSANVVNRGLNYKTIISSLTGFGKTMNVQINTAGGDYAAAIENFFNALDLDSKATVSGNQQNNNSSVSNQTNKTGMITINDYDFITPEQWVLQKNKDHLSIQNPASGCTIKILEPQPSSGDLEKDAKAVFATMYNGWNYSKTGEKQYDLSKGYTMQGLPFFMMEGDMNATNAAGQYITESGAALILKLQNEIVIIAVRHNPGLLGHISCNNNYNTMRRFFNTLAIKNVSVTKPVTDANGIVGLWKTAENMSVSDYVFAANGNYQYGGAIGSSTSTSDDRYVYIQNKAYSFEGDGSYTLTDNVLQLKPRRGSIESKFIRFDQVNHGGTGWKYRLWMRSTGVGGENEVRYEKK